MEPSSAKQVESGGGIINGCGAAAQCEVKTKRVQVAQRAPARRDATRGIHCGPNVAIWGECALAAPRHATHRDAPGGTWSSCSQACESRAAPLGPDSTRGVWDGSRGAHRAAPPRGPMRLRSVTANNTPVRELPPPPLFLLAAAAGAPCKVCHTPGRIGSAWARPGLPGSQPPDPIPAGRPGRRKLPNTSIPPRTSLYSRCAAGRGRGARPHAPDVGSIMTVSVQTPGKD